MNADALTFGLPLPLNALSSNPVKPTSGFYKNQGRLAKNTCIEAAQLLDDIERVIDWIEWLPRHPHMSLTDYTLIEVQTRGGARSYHAPVSMWSCEGRSIKKDMIPAAHVIMPRIGGGAADNARLTDYERLAVYAAGQTKGKSTVILPKQRGNRQLWVDMMTVADRLGVEVAIGDKRGGGQRLHDDDRFAHLCSTTIKRQQKYNGFYSQPDHFIWLREGLRHLGTLTLCHEIAHALMSHAIWKTEADTQLAIQAKKRVEIEAEAVSHAVSALYGCGVRHRMKAAMKRHPIQEGDYWLSSTAIKDNTGKLLALCADAQKRSC